MQREQQLVPHKGAERTALSISRRMRRRFVDAICHLSIGLKSAPLSRADGALMERGKH